ncbi:squalene synthase [Ranunculus cassubicifolius]
MKPLMELVLITKNYYTNGLVVAFPLTKPGLPLILMSFHQGSLWGFQHYGFFYQEAIEEITKRMGAGMAKFILKEIENICSPLANSLGEFGVLCWNWCRELEVTKDVKKEMVLYEWARLIWRENSEKAVQCLNDMVTNALLLAEDCLKYMSALRDPSIFRFCAIPQIMAIGTLALCYNNVAVFRGVVKMRRGLIAKVMDSTKSMSDVYGAFFDFACILKSKVEKKDPNAEKTLSRIEAIQKTCMDSGLSNQRFTTKAGKNVFATLLILGFMLLLNCCALQRF